MSLFRITTDRMEAVPTTTFAREKLLERRDLQRLLRQDLSPIGDDLMVIYEEFDLWEDSKRRIDLLCLSKDRCLVVVELKRDDDGGHMELQALRYAAMVSSMTLDKVIDVYAQTQDGDRDTASAEILDFLGLESEEEAELTGDVRIILVSADFSTELTTAVLWLNKRDLDITCIRLRPYRMGNEILIDATQIIPLPEAAEYEVKLREQEMEKRKVEGARTEMYRRFWGQLIARSKDKTTLLANRSVSSRYYTSCNIGKSGFNLDVNLLEQQTAVDCYIRFVGDKKRTLAAFHALLERREEIEKRFGSTLEWNPREGQASCLIVYYMPGSRYSPESEWLELQDRMIDALIRLEAALRKPIAELTL
ncbi:DUF4268 domain-containing protein [Myxococcota bacterium]|nr:DUF4268 domain-containing protein [Myxococcota bacterium]